MIRSPFKFLDPFGPNDSKVFFGRSAEIDELYALVFRTPLLLVYGLTGTGKTSLIDCGLHNRFDGPDWLPFYVRRKDNLNEALREILRNALPDDKPRELTETVSYLYRYFLRPVYLIFDQFEELFILGTKEEQDEFKHHLKTLLDANLDCKIILIMREEYIGWLYDFEREIPAIFDFRLRVETMKRKNVEDVIEKSCVAFNIALEAPQDNVRQIYDNVSEGKAVVQLPYLQVYLDTLYRTDAQRSYPAGVLPTDEQPYPPLTFTSKEIAECGHISGVLEGFLREKVSELQKSMVQKYPGLPADAVKAVLNSFVSPQGTKKPMPYDLVDDRIRLLFPPDILRDFSAFIHDTVRALEQNRVLRDSGEIFELAHDTLAHKIFENRSEEDKRREEVQARLLTAFKEYQESGTHLNAAQIARLEEWRPLLRLSQAETDFVAASETAVETQRNKEREEAEKERQRAQERLAALQKAQKLIDAFYFYQDNYALAFKDKKFYFINKKGEEVTRLKRWDKAEQFDDDSGFAKVSKKNEGSEEGNSSRKQGDGNNSGTSEGARSDNLNIDNTKSEGTKFEWLEQVKQLNDPVGFQGTSNNSEPLENMGSGNLNYEIVNSKVTDHGGAGTDTQSNDSEPAQASKKNKAHRQDNIVNLPDSRNNPETSEGRTSDSTSKKENIKRKERPYSDFLLDVHGKAYRVCYELADLDNEIMALDLRGRPLEKFPDEIFDYPQLQILILDGTEGKQNKFHTVPEKISKLKNLLYMSFQYCDIKNLPNELGELTKLKQLILSNNQLESVPETIYELRDLTELHLTKNQLNEISDKIANVSKLKILGLGGNKLSKLPDSFWDLSELTAVGLWGNQLSEISNSIGKFSKLQKLYLDQNQLESIPEGLYDLNKLTELTLSDNRLKEISESIGNLPELQILNLSQNQLEYIPEGLYKLRKIKELSLWGNKASKISESIGKFSKLQKLYLDQNRLESMPKAMYKLNQLTELGLSGNLLKEIPQYISKFSKLQKLYLDQNQIGAIPEALYKLNQLTELGFSGNKVKEVSISIGNLPKLQVLYLSKNQLRSIPEALYKLKELKELYLWDNQIKEISKSIGKLSKLQKLNLENNQLDSLPREIYKLKELAELDLKQNKFSLIDESIFRGTIFLKQLDRSPIARLGFENIIKELQADGREKLNGEKYSEAIGLFKQALLFENKLNRLDNAELHSQLAMCYLLHKDNALAQKHYQKAVNSLRSQSKTTPGILIGETWNSFIPDSRQFWTLRDWLRSLETSPGINQDFRSTLTDTCNALTRSLDKLYSLDKSSNELIIPIVTPLVLEIGNDLVPKVDPQTDGGKFLEKDIPAMRERIEKDTGVVVTGVRARGNPNIDSGHFIIQLDEVPVFRGSVKVANGYCPASSDVIGPLGVPPEAIATAPNPWTSKEGCWIPFEYEDKIRQAGLELWTETLFIIYQLEVVLRRNLANFLGIQEVETILENHAKTPEGERQITTALPDRQSRLHFARLLRTLVKENTRITNTGEMLQAVRELQINSGNFDETVRQIRLRNKALLPGNQPGVQRFELPGDREEMLIGWLRVFDGRAKFTPPPDKAHDLIQEIARLVPAPNGNSVLVVQNYQTRPFLRRLLENRYPDLMVMSAEELDEIAVFGNKNKD